MAMTKNVSIYTDGVTYESSQAHIDVGLWLRYRRCYKWCNLNDGQFEILLNDTPDNVKSIYVHIIMMWSEISIHYVTGSTFWCMLHTEIHPLYVCLFPPIGLHSKY